jgi:hypothetical protein
MISIDGRELSKCDRVRHAHLDAGTVISVTEDYVSIEYDSLAYGLYSQENCHPAIIATDNCGTPRR